MPHFDRLAARTVDFGRDQRGNFAVVTAAITAVLALSVGFALNTGQLALTRSNLSQALDSAVTSTARDITIGTIKPEDARRNVEAFLLANGGTGFAAAETITLDTLTLDKATNTLSASASVDLELAFPLFRVANVQRVRAASASIYSDKKIEVAMMLDITGSMKGQKIKDLKTAAKNAVKAFLGGQNKDNPRVRMSIVPYADAVNVGADLAPFVHVEEKFTTGEPPVYDPRHLASAKSAKRKDNCATERKGALQFSDAAPTSGMINRDVRLAFCPVAVLQPLTSDMDRLIKTIDDFRDNGHTAGHIGVQWTRYMLSPKWRDFVPADSAATDYKSKKVAKIAILMTDGEFNTAFADVPNGSDIFNQGGRGRTKAETLCAEMRKDGIEIFTIGFMLRESGAKAVMKNCASPDVSAIKHYYEVADGAALDAAFQAIAANVERLAIIK
jgi:Flp pilus assembly protein TadG